jgi:hypothetical protein
MFSGSTCAFFFFLGEPACHTQGEIMLEKSSSGLRLNDQYVFKGPGIKVLEKLIYVESFGFLM